MPAVFAFADKVIGQPQTSLFAAFGSIALLVLVEFTGPPKARLVAYLGLACVGAVYITLGTLCSRHDWLAAGAAISALILLWPPRQRSDFQRHAADALRTVATLLDASRETRAERARGA